VLSKSEIGRRPFWRRSRPPPSQSRASLTDPNHLPCMPCSIPGGPDQVLVGWRVARSRAGFFPVRTAFPVIGAGRHPHHYFRGLLKLHTRYGSGARKLPSSTNNLLGWVLPPLVICAFEAHPLTPFTWRYRKKRRFIARTILFTLLSLATGRQSAVRKTASKCAIHSAQEIGFRRRLKVSESVELLRKIA
jgi:hypothetical protein